MAYIKIFPIKSTVKKAVDYITNPDKTEEQLLVSSFGCTPETAELEFEMTRETAKRMLQDRKNENLARHLIISFKPGEIPDAHTAHNIGKEIADEVLKGRYEYVLSTHIDKNHYHCHVIFNDVSFVDYHRYRSNKKTYHKICQISNRICKKYGLQQSMPTGEKAKSYKENMEYKKGNSWKAKLKYAVDRAIWSSVTYDEFLVKMQEANYEIREGKYLAFRAPDQKHFTNVKTLGAYYSEERILIRLQKNRYQARIPKNLSPNIRMFVQVSSFVADHNRPGFEYWAKKNNFKEAVKTFNYLSEHNLLNYDDFQNHISDLENSINATDESIATIEKEIQNQLLLQKNCESYRICREVILEEERVTDKKAYRQKHNQQYLLHDQILKELAEQGIHKLPSKSKLQKQYDQLQDQLSSLKKEKNNLLKQQKNLQAIENNFNSMIENSGLSIPEKDTKSKTPEDTLS